MIRYLYFDIKKQMIFEFIWSLSWLFYLYFLLGLSKKETWSLADFLVLILFALSPIYHLLISYRRNKQQQLAIRDTVLMFKGYRARLMTKTFLFLTSIEISASTENDYHKMTVSSAMFSKEDWSFLLKYSYDNRWN